MEPIGWVSCGCGKGVNIYARKQEKKEQAKQTVEKVAEALGDEKGQPWKLERHMEHKPFKAETSAAAQDPKQQKLCAWCGKPFKHASKHIKCCTWDCYCKKKAQGEETKRVEAVAYLNNEVARAEQILAEGAAAVEAETVDEINANGQVS